MIVGGELVAVYSYVIAQRKIQALVHTPIRAHVQCPAVPFLRQPPGSRRS
jgi:hypothetical protein